MQATNPETSYELIFIVSIETTLSSNGNLAITMEGKKIKKVKR